MASELVERLRGYIDHAEGMCFCAKSNTPWEQIEADLKAAASRIQQSEAELERLDTGVKTLARQRDVERLKVGNAHDALIAIERWAGDNGYDALAERARDGLFTEWIPAALDQAPREPRVCPKCGSDDPDEDLIPADGSDDWPEQMRRGADPICPDPFHSASSKGGESNG